jgi:3-methyladenine DNA glycosylase AlkD
MLALLILVLKYAKGDARAHKRIYALYLKNTQFINNWDLVDASAHYIVGPFLMDESKKPLYRLAASKSLWERRIAIMATFHYIRHNLYSETLKIAETLISDKEDLIHKAVGWMLREIGKRDLQTEEEFLNSRYKEMPRTMLRYAIEKFPAAQRRLYLKGEIDK